MDKGQLAIEKFKSGYNCAQAVLLAFKDEIGMSEEQLEKIIIGFGGGFARQGLICGAVCGMTAAIGCLISNGMDKLDVYPIVKEACQGFERECGSLVCSELKQGAKLSCAELCAVAARLVEQSVKK